eukprot:jgi/Chrzof1/9321/UNPLg00290.t1
MPVTDTFRLTPTSSRELGKQQQQARQQDREQRLNDDHHSAFHHQRRRPLADITNAQGSFRATAPTLQHAWASHGAPGMGPAPTAFTLVPTAAADDVPQVHHQEHRRPLADVTNAQLRQKHNSAHLFVHFSHL